MKRSTFVWIWLSGLLAGILLVRLAPRDPGPAAPPAPSPAAAPAPADAPRADRLEEENLALRREIERLEARLAAAPAPTEPLPERGAPPSRLRERLSELRALFSAGTPSEAALAEASRGLRQGILSDPDGFLAFLASEQDPAVLKACMDALLLVDRSPGGPSFIHTQRVEQFPEGLMDGLLGVLRTGTPDQQKAVLGFFNYPLSGQTPAFRDAFLGALAEEDPGVQAGALQALASEWGRWGGDAALGAHAARIARIADLAEPRSPGARSALELLARMGTPEADGYLLSRMESRPDGPTAALLSDALSRRPDPARSVRFEQALLGAASRIPPADYEMFVQTCLRLPPGSAAGILEEAARRCPTPGLREATERMTARLREGGALSAADRAAFDEAWQEHLREDLSP